MKNTESLFEKLNQHHAQDIYPLHMPGHKRALPSPGNVYEMDITEIGGFDCLHHATGILREISRRAARLYHADETYLLIGGSTAGLLCAISAVCKAGETLLMARNCHRAVYNAAYLNRLHVSYVYPQWLDAWGMFGGVSAEAVDKALGKDASIGAVVITSPTYEGMVSDVAAIAACCHRHGAVLVVDEAHGAHFGFSQGMPQSAVTLGADVVIQSLHKTMPALTQTALLHVNGTRVDRTRIARYFSIYQTSSPSYVLMGSIDACITLMETEGAQLFADYEARLKVLRQALAENKRLKLVQLDEKQKKDGAVYAVDPGRIVLSLRNNCLPASGGMLLQQFRKKYRMELEMAGLDYVVAIVTAADTDEGLRRFAQAARKIDAGFVRMGENMAQAECGQETDKAAKRKTDAGFAEAEETVYGQAAVDTETESAAKTARETDVRDALQIVPQICMPLAQAYDGRTEGCPLFDSAGEISAEFVYLYPPGIPLIVPGERIQEAHLTQLARAMEQGISVEGPADITLSQIRVIWSDV